LFWCYETQVALAQAEMVNYQQAHAVFEQMRIIAPDRLEGLEVYSTVLWHLKKEAELSCLAQDAVSLDRWAPQTWCIAGNCFSLQGEHEHAIKLIDRAIQLDPNHTYAHTLMGHEHFANENLEGALASFRAARSVDSRHYNAWYGMGIVYQRYARPSPPLQCWNRVVITSTGSYACYRQEKYSLAESHFKQALEINNRSSVLCCYLGMTLHCSNRTSEALEWFERARGGSGHMKHIALYHGADFADFFPSTSLNVHAVLDNRNYLARYEEARTLVTRSEYKKARAELESLKDNAPHEPSIFKLLGWVIHMLNEQHDAQLYMQTALDLRPSSSEANEIKAEMERMEERSARQQHCGISELRHE
jgi:anaphase-promoting complex subunit 3